MKVLLVNGNPFRPAVPPIGLEYVCEAARGAGHEAKIFDFSHQDRVGMEAEITSFCPDVVGITLRNIDTGHLFNSVSYIPVLTSLVGDLRKCFGGPIVLGGAGFSLLPGEILRTVRADFGVVGEGEQILPMLLENLDNPSCVPNLAILDQKTGGVTCTARVASGCQSFQPKRDTVDHPRYYSLYGGFKNHSLANIQTKRGCNKRCTYCAEPEVIGRDIVKRDPEEIVEEIKRFLAKGIDKQFFFVDSEFNVCTEHAAAVCEALIEHDVRIGWTAYLTPDNTDLELIQLMQRAGCTDMVWSMESACDKVLQGLGKSYQASDTVRVAQACDGLGQRYTFLLMFGGPGESEETVRETWRNTQLLRNAFFGVITGVRIYPSTALARQALKDGVAKSERDLLLPTYYREEYTRNVIYPVVAELFKGRSNSVVLGPETKTKFD
jgi:radical SAM superfamily enzyme YgiQ (UPF0313 family)